VSLPSDRSQFNTLETRFLDEGAAIEQAAEDDALRAFDDLTEPGTRLRQRKNLWGLGALVAGAGILIAVGLFSTRQSNSAVAAPAAAPSGVVAALAGTETRAAEERPVPARREATPARRAGGKVAHPSHARRH
jgi:hypothetical protein